MALQATAPTLRALIIATRPDWFGPARLPAVLADAGFKVSALCPENALLTYARPLERCVTFRPGLPVTTFWNRILFEMTLVQPDLVIPADDDAAQVLHDMYDRLASHSDQGDARAVLERSLGNPSRYAQIERKSSLVEMSQRTGVAIPDSRVLQSVEDGLDFAAGIGYPVLLKRDHGGGGAGIIACSNPLELQHAYQDLTATPAGVRREQPVVTAQRMVQGVTASVNLTAQNGKMLTSFAWLREHVNPAPFGLASVAQLIDAPELQELARQVVAYFGFSGLGAVQFLLDGPQQTPLVMEFNARATPLCNLGAVFGVDLIAALRASLLSEAMPALQPARFKRIALFPNELRRDPQSSELNDPLVFHDVPSNQPELLEILTRGR